jgi:hypothetical protein
MNPPMTINCRVLHSASKSSHVRTGRWFESFGQFYQWDPTKLFIRTASLLGLASQLKTFPDNEIRRGQFADDHQLPRLALGFKVVPRKDGQVVRVLRPLDLFTSTRAAAP